MLKMYKVVLIIAPNLTQKYKKFIDESFFSDMCQGVVLISYYVKIEENDVFSLKQHVFIVL